MRKPRIEFERALYHVINRGNYRYDVFEDEGSARAFEANLKGSRRYLLIPGDPVSATG